MSRPSEGSYCITSRVVSGKGEPLALTYTGNGKPVVVTPLKDNAPQSSQKWIIKNYGSTAQTIAPASDRNLQAGWGRTIVTMPSGGYAWTITQTPADGCVIQDGNKSVKWTMENANDGQEVTPSGSNMGEKQYWIFRLVN